MGKAWYQVHVFDGDSSWFGGVRSTSVIRSPQMSPDDWYKLLKKWKRNEEKQRKEQRAKERLRLQNERLKLERQKEERLRKEQQLREEKYNKEKRTSNNFWGSNSSNKSSGKIYVPGYRRKDGTEVKGYWREK